MAHESTPSNYTEAPHEVVDTHTDKKHSKTVRVMDRLHAEEIFTTPEKSKEFLDSLDFDEFKKWCDMVNGMERGIPAVERGKASESVVQAEGGLTGVSIEYQPPYKVHREGLLQKAFEKAQSIDDPEVAGLTLGMSMNAIHFYEDGNGRTGRMLYALLSQGYDGSDESKQLYTDLLENTSGREIVNPNPEVSGVGAMIRNEMIQKASNRHNYDPETRPHYIQGGYNAFLGEEALSNIITKDGISDTSKVLLHQILRDEKFNIIPVYLLFKPEEVEQFLITRSDGNKYVDGDKFAASLDNGTILKLFKAGAATKKAYVDRIINFSDRNDAAAIIEAYRKAPIFENAA